MTDPIIKYDKSIKYLGKLEDTIHKSICTINESIEHVHDSCKYFLDFDSNTINDAKQISQLEKSINYLDEACNIFSDGITEFGLACDESQWTYINMLKK